MGLFAFGTSPHGLGIPPERFWYLSAREYEAYERVWKNSRKQDRFQWAAMMAMMYNINRGNASAKSMFDWLPEEDKPKQSDKPWIVKDVESQKLSIMQALAFAAGFNEGKEPS